jgi:26S proteasome regulatory subunit N3
VKAVRREYGESLDMLNQAIRKCPDTAKGFKIICQKAAIVVELLLGEIPNREIFSDVLIFTNVYPYCKLIQVVLEGELSNFNRTVEEYKPTFQKDGLYNIILRLNQIVIRIGLRKISLAYSRISLADIASKLKIPGEDVEFVVAKALRDGIMQGEIDHESQILRI